MAERVGFEPTIHCCIPDFESGPLWPLRYLSKGTRGECSTTRTSAADNIIHYPQKKIKAFEHSFAKRVKFLQNTDVRVTKRKIQEKQVLVPERLQTTIKRVIINNKKRNTTVNVVASAQKRTYVYGFLRHRPLCSMPEGHYGLLQRRKIISNLFANNWKRLCRLRTERCSASMRFTLQANRFLQCATTRFLLKTCQKQTLFLHSSDCGYPYDGAKEHYVLDVENKNLTSQAVNALVAIMPVPKKNSR